MKPRPADRLSFIKDYYFARKLNEVRQLEAQGGKPFLVMAIGNPDLPPPPEVTESLVRHLHDPQAHKYQSYSGLPSFKQAIADFYRRRFDVDLDPATQILPLLGSKSGIMWLSLAYLNPGDKVLIPEPGYMAYGSASRLAGGRPEAYRLNEADWMPDLDNLTPSARQARIMWMNYTNMPTGTPATPEFLEKFLRWSEDFSFVLAFDNPYSLITEQPLSVLRYSRDLPVVEFQSMSKNFNMAGWRIGWVAGHPDIIAQMAKVQSNVETGMFYPLQKAAETALALPDDWFRHINHVYARRKQKVKAFIEPFGGECSTRGGGMFCWVKLPEGVSGEALADELFYRHRIFIAPGTIFGPSWKNYVRISLTVPEEVYTEALARLTEPA